MSFSYQFDGLDRVTGVGEGSSTSNLLTIPYHPNGGRDSLLRDSGAQTRYAYDAAQRIDQYTQDLAGSGNDLTTGFDFNPAGQITRLSRSNDLYHYFGNNNKTGAYVVNGLNQYKSVDGQSYHYDPNGNLDSDGANTYTYDNENRLTAVAGSVNASLEYDPLGRLFKVTANGVTRQFLYDGDALVAEYSLSNITPLVRYVHGDRVDEPWVQYNGASVGQNQRIYLHTDHQHSVIAHSGGLGNSINTLRYDGYGIADTGNVGRFGYTGQVWLAEIGLYYYKARMYSPALGRFMQTDPIGYEDQMNLYAYVGNDPLNLIDPTGKYGISGTSAPTMQAVSDACGGSTECMTQVAADMGMAQAVIASTLVPDATDIVIASAVVKAAQGVKATKIIDHTKHSLDQKINRQVKSADELDAVKNPLKKTDVKVDSQGRPSQKLIGEKATVSVNPDTKKAVTVHPTSSKLAEKLKKEQELNQ